MKTNPVRPFVVFRPLPTGGRIYVGALTITGGIAKEERDMSNARRFSHRQALAVCARNGASWIVANVNPPGR